MQEWVDASHFFSLKFFLYLDRNGDSVVSKLVKNELISFWLFSVIFLSLPLDRISILSFREKPMVRHFDDILFHQFFFFSRWNRRIFVSVTIKSCAELTGLFLIDFRFHFLDWIIVSHHCRQFDQQSILLIFILTHFFLF